MRDARITTIYEGTTGIQANDLIGRKLAREGGVTLKAVIAMMRQSQTAAAKDQALAGIAAAFGTGIDALERAAEHIVANYGSDVRSVAVGAVPFLKLMGIVSGGWMMTRAALAAQAQMAAGDGDSFYPTKLATAAFYASTVLAAAPGLAQVVVVGGPSALAISDELM
jgi:hypothetical protein